MNFYCLIKSDFTVIPALAYSTKDGYDEFHKKWIFFYDFNKHKPLSNEKATLNSKTKMWSYNLLFYGGINLNGELKIFVDDYLEFELITQFNKNQNYKNLIDIKQIENFLKDEIKQNPQTYQYLEKFLCDFSEIKDNYKHLSRSVSTGLWF